MTVTSTFRWCGVVCLTSLLSDGQRFASNQGQSLLTILRRSQLAQCIFQAIAFSPASHYNVYWCWLLSDILWNAETRYLMNGVGHWLMFWTRKKRFVIITILLVKTLNDTKGCRCRFFWFWNSTSWIKKTQLIFRPFIYTWISKMRSRKCRNASWYVLIKMLGTDSGVNKYLSLIQYICLQAVINKTNMNEPVTKIATIFSICHVRTLAFLTKCSPIFVCLHSYRKINE